MSTRHSSRPRAHRSDDEPIGSDNFNYHTGGHSGNSGGPLGGDPDGDLSKDPSDDDNENSDDQNRRHPRRSTTSRDNIRANQEPIAPVCNQYSSVDTTFNATEKFSYNPTPQSEEEILRAAF
ncbi:hypothetical protein L218DRAFT_1005462 [Marasmius fiardii PR-910]|nr:hypothetical protein L218DRAFT_1005462 [Marasmius fiardii PR-910]